MEMTFTESAADQAKVILASEEEGLNLRCFIQGGGCSGFQYGFTLDKQKDEDSEEYIFSKENLDQLIKKLIT